MLAHIVLISHFSSSEFWFFLEGVSAMLPHQLNVFIRAQCVFGSIVMIQICDWSHMNISTFCFAFWQSPIFPRHPTQTARYVLALINHRYIHLAILVRDNSLQRRGQHGARGAARSVAPMDHPPLEEDVPITRLADRNPMLNASSQRKMNNELAKCSIYGDIFKK